jgi:membrane-associated phospholipid phosphatase
LGVQRDVRNLLLGALACLVALAPVAILAYAVGPTERLDADILARFAPHDQGSLHALAAAFGAMGEAVPVFLILALLVGVGFAAGRRREAVAAAVIVLGAGITTQVLKQVLAHARHASELHGYELPWPDAFPSGHTTAAASLAVAALFVVPPRLRAVTAAVGGIFTAGMAFSVVLMQWHYPSDTIGACLVVGAWTCAALAALRAMRPARPAEPPSRVRRAEGAGDERFAVSLR